jgi:hypothetical protein
MGVRIEVGEGKSLHKALREMKSRRHRYKGDHYLLMKREWRLLEPSEYRRWKAWKAKKGKLTKRRTKLPRYLE